MASGQDGAPDNGDAERERFSAKLDGYEAMGLNVDDLRRLLDEDMEEFKATYLAVIKAQLEGGPVETPEEGPEEEPPKEIQVGGAPEDEGETEVPEEEPTPPYKMESGPSEGEEGPSEEVTLEELAEEETVEEMELQLEGAGPEEALAEAEVPEEEIPEGEPEEEEVEIAIEEEAPEEAEEVPEGAEEAPEEAEGVPEEAKGVPEDAEEIPEDAEKAPEEAEEVPEEAEEVPEEAEEVPEEAEEVPEEGAEIEVGEAEEEAQEEAPGEEPEEEALIVVAEVVEETPEVTEEETEIRLAGLTAEERGEEIPQEEPEPERPKVRPKPVKKAVAKRPVAGVEPPKEVPPREAPPKKAPEKKTPSEKEPPKKAPAKKAPTKKKAPPSKARRRAIPMSVIAILVVALLVSASAGIYFIFLRNEPPTALFTFDPGEPLVGELVTFDARNTFDPDDGTIEKYVWDFGDGTSDKGRVVSHAFIEARSFQVRLTIEDDGGARDSTQRTVDVSALEISMERPYEGDLFQYDVTGHVFLRNPTDGLFSFEGPTGQREYVWGVEADMTGEKTFEVTGTRQATDGFMKPHNNARTERTYYYLDQIQGTMDTSLSINPTFNGDVEATVDEDVCQHWERGVRSSVAVYTDFSATVAQQNWATLTTSDEGTFYSQLAGIEDTFSLSGFLRGTTFSSEDRNKYNLTLGSSTYQWQVRGMERVEGRDLPSLHINVTMDRDTLEANDLDSFFIDVWLEQGLSQPSQHHVYVKGQDEGDRYGVDLTETLTSESMGSEEAHDLPCSADHAFTMKGEYPDDFDQLDRVPERGGTAGGFQFSPEEAYQAALADINDFPGYLARNPDAFFHLGNYTQNGDQGRWEMTFGEEGSSEHYWIEARMPSDTVEINDNDEQTDDTLPMSSRSEIGEVVTLSRGSRLLRAEPEIGALCFNGQNVDWTKYTFNVTEGVSTISLDPTSVLVGSQETGYVYMLVGRTGPVHHRAALDATNGQVLFTWKHIETWDFRDITL